MNIIGVFGIDKQMCYDAMNLILETLNKNDIKKIKKVQNLYQFEMNNGDIYIGFSLGDSVIGYRFKQIYVYFNINRDILYDVIRPNIVSDLHINEQIKTYMLDDSQNPIRLYNEVFI